MDGDKPIFSVKRSSIIGRSRASLTVEIYEGGEINGGGGEDQGYYQIEGCFAQRNCTIYNGMKEPMAEIRRKVDQSTSVLLGKEVFTLCVKAGFDGAFAMGLVLVLDQINGDDGVVDNGTEPTVYPTADD